MNLERIPYKINAYSLGILAIFHLIGLGIFLTPNRPENLSGYNMLLCAVLVFLSAAKFKKEAILLLFIALGGWLIECLGVNTGYLFGSYTYGTELGPKWLGVPLVLGLNWYCIVAASSAIVIKYITKLPLLIKAAAVATLAVTMDFFIEPIAIKYDFWTWEAGEIPLFNYSCWFGFSFLFAVAYLKWISTLNKTAYYLFFIWLLFFGLLNLF